jgi:hypothetical protein
VESSHCTDVVLMPRSQGALGTAHITDTFGLPVLVQTQLNRLLPIHTHVNVIGV